MRTTRPVLLALLLAALAGCGSGEPVLPAAPGPWSRECAGKPAPAIGAVEVVLAERLAVDRVVIEARWERGLRGSGRRVELVLPEGAWLIEGRAGQALEARAQDGLLRWTVGHETGRALDAVVRLRALADGVECGRETVVRLTDA